MSPVAFFVGAAIGLVGTLLARKVAQEFGIVDHPNPLVPQHTAPVPYLGGLGIATGMCLTIPFVLGTGYFSEHRALLLGATAFLCFGLYDDVRPLRPASKLAFQLVLSLGIAGLGVRGQLTGNIVTDSVIAAMWITAIVNAVNVTDVCDGLVGGLAVIAYLCLARLSAEISVISSVAAGSAVGFLLVNRPPAKIFLGDGGSHLLGFLLAAFTLIALPRTPEVFDLLGAILVCGVFLFEAIFISLMRASHGRSWWQGSSDHVALRLQNAGFTRLQVDAVAWLAGALLGVASLIVIRGTLPIRAITISVVSVSLVVTAYFLSRCPAPTS